jgi:hypothetical protein
MSSNINQALRNKMADRVYMAFEFVGQVLEVTGWMRSPDQSEWSRQVTLAEAETGDHHHVVSARVKVRFIVRFNEDDTIAFASAQDDHGLEHGAPGEPFPLPIVSGESEYVPKAVQLAVEHVVSLFPKVTHIFFNVEGRWFFCDDDFEGPTFGVFRRRPEIDFPLLEEAAKSLKSLPAAFSVAKVRAAANKK